MGFNRRATSLKNPIASGGTALLDAIIATSDYAQQNGKRRRKAIVVISDGLEKNSAVKEKEVIKAIKENEVQLYLIGFLDEDDSKSFFGASSKTKAKGLLNRLAEDSGGRAYFREDLNEYTLGFFSTNDRRDGSFRKLAVNVKRPGYGARAPWLRCS